jgi:hypothetical protein
MADLLVSRIQNRRGNMVDLPQPLRAGEFGWCLDTGRLFIGSDDDPGLVASGVHIFANLIPTAQTILDENILIIDTSGATFDFATFVTDMGNPANFPTVSGLGSPPATVEIGSDNILEDSASNLVFVALTDDQKGAGAANVPSYQTDILAILVTQDAVNFIAGDITLAGATYTIGPEGTFSTATHETANALSELMNNVSDPVAIANTNLNIEVLTDGNLGLEDIIMNPTAFTLAATDVYPAIGTFADFPITGITYDTALTDTFLLEYSVYGDDGSNYIHMTGAMKISTLDSPQKVSMAEDFVRSEDPDPLNGEIQFQPVISSGSVKLQYSHNLPMSVDFKTTARRWLSF